jgi:dihydrolipoamide dehydrogenase
MLVVGGGYVGLELGTVYAALGTQITLVEYMDRLLPGVDQDLVEPLHRKLKGMFAGIHLNTKVVSLAERDGGVDVKLEGDGGGSPQTFDRVLVAVGRRPSSQGLGLENTSVKLDDQGFVVIDEQMRTTDKHIFAAGDVAGGMMLAHKATREGKIAAEVIAGQSSAFDARAIPAVVYTDPQIAWCGLTEEEARREKVPVQVARLPWSASGRAATMGVTEGLTKLILDSETGRVLGAGIAGRGAEALIAECVLAVEMGALAEDLALSVHPHPSLTETVGEAAELFMGGSIHFLGR